MPRRRRLLPTVTLLLAVIMLPCIAPASVWADRLGARGVQLENSYPSANTTYKFFVTINTPTTVGSLRVMFCSNSPLEDDGCTIPSGLDVTQEHIVAASGFSAFNVFPEATNQLLVSWGPVTITPPLQLTLTLDNIDNPDAVGFYYGRYATYGTTNGTGPVIDFGGLAFAINTNITVSSYVPPYLTFCTGVQIPTLACSSATGDYINLGSLAANHSSQASSQMMVATNAANGYIIQVYGSTMTSGNNIINALAANAGSHPGSPQFGINLSANSVPPIGGNPSGPGVGQAAAGYNVPNSFRFVPNDIVASSIAADDYRKYTVSYIVNVPPDQAPGVYASTVTYVAAGSF